MPGTLFLVSTPIGNLADVSLRALQVLKTVSVVACEDTRVTRRLMERYQIRTALVSYHEHNERRRAAELAQRLLAGEDVALVSDAGTPGVSDPGYRLLSLAREKQLPVRVVPGPSAVLAALSASGLPASGFVFIGFLPTRPSARKRALDSLAALPYTAVVFESARRLPRLLLDLAETLGSRPAYLGRELTKIHEEHRWGSLPELAEWASRQSLKGEITLVIQAEKAEAAEKGDAALKPMSEARQPLLARFQELTAAGYTRRQAVKAMARERDLPARLVYERVLIGEDD